MRPSQRASFFLAASAAAALSLAGCAAGTPAGSGAAPAATSLATATPDAESPAPSSTATTSPAATIVPAATSSPVPRGPQEFTFADGRLSFAYPAGWRVEHEQVTTSPAVETVTVIDADGKEQINIYYGEVGDATAGNVTRTVIETDVVRGLMDFVPAHSSFFIDRADGATQYRMGLTPGLPVSPTGQVQYGLVKLGDRILTADVLFGEPRFDGPEAAQAWYWSAEGQAVKGVLMSFSYR